MIYEVALLIMLKIMYNDIRSSFDNNDNDNDNDLRSSFANNIIDNDNSNDNFIYLFDENIKGVNLTTKNIPGQTTSVVNQAVSPILVTISL